MDPHNVDMDILNNLLNVVHFSTLYHEMLLSDHSDSKKQF